MGYILGLLGLILVGINYLMLSSLKGHFKASQKKDEGELLLEGIIREDIGEEVEALKVTMGDFAKRLEDKLSELEKKTAVLGDLIRLAEEKIERLTELETNKEKGFANYLQEEEFERIYRLQQKGRSINQIAKTLGISQGEVKLRLGILNQRNLCK